MSEETEGQDTGAEAVAGSADPAAVALALGGASREKADAFLDNQNALVADQRHHLHRQLVQVELRIWEQRMGLLLRIAAGFVGFMIAAGLALMIWDAAHADGLVVEAFSVPPDLASRGLSGQVVAGQMLDKLLAMQNTTGSVRPAQSYANNWGEDLKVEIPDTGVSISELYRFLRGWLGHETHVTGEVYRTATGIAVTARTGTDAGGTYAGPESDLDGLVQKAAENVYGNTQPFRYAFYLMFHSEQAGSSVRVAEARAIFTKLTSDPSPLEHSWGWGGLSVLAANVEGNNRAAEFDAHKALALTPDFTPSYLGLSSYGIALGHAESVLADSQSLERALNRSDPPNFSAPYVIPDRLLAHQTIDVYLGDYTDAVRTGRSGAEIDGNLGSIDPDTFRINLALSLARQHDGMGALTYFDEMPPPPAPVDQGFRAITRLQMDAALENWQAVIAAAPSVERTFVEFARGHDIKANVGTQIRPFLALAKARSGDTAGAEAVIAATALDCYDCVRMRGVIAALARQPARADFWFARAIGHAPSIPFAYADWGQALLARGQPDAAIEKFKLANQKGPHFADPLEGWGEALMAKNQSHLAVAKFALADKYAPNWGRLHLKWGEALYYMGKKDEATVEFSRAGALDLTPPEKAELAKFSNV